MRITKRFVDSLRPDAKATIDTVAARLETVAGMTFVTAVA